MTVVANHDGSPKVHHFTGHHHRPSCGPRSHRPAPATSVLRATGPAEPTTATRLPWHQPMKGLATDPSVALEGARDELQRKLSAGSISIEAFGREWRRLGRPGVPPPVMPDELRLHKAQVLLSDFSTLWRNPAVPDRLREEALHEVFVRFDVRGAELIAAHPQPNENAWLLGYAAMRE